MDIDGLLPLYSKQNFHHLEYGELRIIKLIAESGFLNLSEIGKFTSKYTIGFDRWGVKNRIYGSKQFRGLISRDYVQQFVINGKEKKYGLTVKGLCAALQLSKFENIYLIKRYSQFLEKYLKNKSDLDIMLKYIKHEIAFLLYNNCLQGIDWTNFLYLKNYLEKNREHKGYPNSRLNLEIDEEITVANDDIYRFLGKQYSNFHILSFSSIGYIKSKVMWDRFFKKDTKPYVKSKTIEKITLAIFVSHWFRYIDAQKLDMELYQLAETYRELDHL